jgi:hypothetical protein
MAERGAVRVVRPKIAALGVGILAVGALAACGEDPVGSQLAPATESGDVIVVTPDSNLARQLAGAPDAPPAIELTLADGVAVPATTGTLAWTTAAGEPGAEVVQALAVALGANGEVERDAAGAWTVGASPGDPVGLLVGGYLGDSFAYTSAARWEQLAANPCDPSSECPGPIGVPDEAAALTAMQRVLDALGIEREDAEVDTDVRTDGMGVTVRALIDGVPPQTEPDVELLVGSDGSILQAGGRTSVADQTRTVDLIDAETAIARAERSISAGPFLTRPPIAELPATTSLVPTQPTTTPPWMSPGDSGVPVTVYPTADTVTGFGVGHELVWDVDGRRWIVPTFTVSTASNMLFTVFAIDPGMVRVVDAPIGDRDDGGLWGGGSPPELAPPITPEPALETPAVPAAAPTTSLPPPPSDSAPAPALTTAIPGTTAVVPCSGTPPSDQPVPTVPPALPGPVEGRTREDWGVSMVRSISPVVIGLPTAEAAVLLEVACWTVRISYPDGSTTTITPDLPWDRIVLVDDGNGRVADVVFQ